LTIRRHRDLDALRAQAYATDPDLVRQRQARNLAMIREAVGDTFPARLRRTEETEIQEALCASDWNVKQAAHFLGMKRTTLAARMAVLGIRRPKPLAMAAGGGY